MKAIKISDNSAKTACSGKFWFLSYSPKSSRPQIARFLFLDPRLWRLGPMNSPSCVRPSVRPCVRNSFFSELAWWIFLIFCMQLQNHESKKVTRPDFQNFCSMDRKRVKWAQKRGFLRFDGKVTHESMFKVILNQRYDDLWHFGENRMFGKILVQDLRPKKLSANQIAAFFFLQYLFFGLRYKLEIWSGDTYLSYLYVELKNFFGCGRTARPRPFFDFGYICTILCIEKLSFVCL